MKHGLRFLSLTAAGVVRETIPVGQVRVSDIFNAASLGVGTEGELISIYVTGSDLMNVYEVDASVYPLMHSAQLFCSGAEYAFNTNRMIFNKVDYAMLRRNDGALEAIDPDGRKVIYSPWNPREAAAKCQQVHLDPAGRLRCGCPDRGGYRGLDS